MIEYQIERLLSSRLASSLVIATTLSQVDDELCLIAEKMGVSYFRGSEEDVLDRFYNAALEFNMDNIIRCNADCPLIDPSIIDDALHMFFSSFPKLDYVSNILEETYPIGMHVEVLSFDALREAYNNATDPMEREHVTPYVYRRPNKYRLGVLRNGEEMKRARLTVDYPIDLEVVNNIYQSLYAGGRVFALKEIMDYLSEHPEVAMLNSHFEKASTV